MSDKSTQDLSLEDLHTLPQIYIGPTDSINYFAFFILRTKAVMAKYITGYGPKQS